MNDVFHSHQVLTGKDQKLVVASDRSHEWKPSFLMLGKRVPELMLELSQDTNATWLFWTLMKRRQEMTNECYLNRSDLTETEYARVKRGYLLLKQLGICRRIQRGRYMLNPDMVIPRQGYFAVMKEWSNEKG